MKITKIFTRPVFIGLILVLVLGLAGTGLGVASKAKPALDRPFSGSYTAIYEVDSTHTYEIGDTDYGFTEFTNIRTSYTGDGNFAHLGSSNIVGDGIWVWDDSVGTLRDEVTITAANGDKVYARITGTQSGDEFHGTYIIWGGTGPYEGAQGNGTVSATITATSETGTIVSSMEGIIIYPPQPPPPPATPPEPTSPTGREGEPAPYVEPRQLQPTYAAATPWPDLVGKMIIEKDVPVPMRDGLRLAADVYRPAEPGQYPVIVAETIYGKDFYWQVGYPGYPVAFEPWSCVIWESMSFEAADPAFWVPHGYVVVVYDVRDSVRSPGERMWGDSWDAYDVIEWAGQQEWSNGNVGLSGVSYLAGFQLGVAALNPPHLKAIAPWEGHGYGYWGTGGITRTWLLRNIMTILPEIPAWDPPAVQRERMPDPRPKHEQYAAIEAPALIGASWSSHGLLTEPAFAHWLYVGSDKWLYTHGREKWAPYYSTDYSAMVLMFFDHYLKGSDDRILDIPQVRIEVRVDMDTYLVRWEDDFPILGTDYQRLYLDASDGTLKFEEPTVESSVSYLSTTEDSATFDYTFTEDTELTGYMKLMLWFAPEDYEDADIFITLRKFDSEGNEVFWTGYDTPYYYPVAHSALRISNRELDPLLSTEYYPQLLRGSGGTATVTPGEIVPLEIAILPTSTLFHEGETLRVEVSGVYRPGDVLRFTYPALEKGDTGYFWHVLNEGEHTVHTGGAYDSYLLIPIIP